MKKKNKSGIFIALGIGAGLYFLLNRNKPTTTPVQFQNVPARPATKGESFNAWAKSIIDLYGYSSKLFQPGGPFYKIPTKDIIDIIDTPKGGGTYDDPTTGGSNGGILAGIVARNHSL
jgi:hypothetical protein